MITLQIIITIILIVSSFTATNLIDKFIVSKKAKNNYAYTVVSVSVFFAESIILSLFITWKGITIQDLTIPFITGLMSGFFYIAYFYTLKHEEASQIIPLMNLQPVGLTLIHVFIIGTIFTRYQLFGIIVAVLGVIILESHKTVLSFFKSKATLLGMGYGLLVAIPMAMNESASNSMPFLNMQMPFATGALITASILLIKKDVRATIKEHYKLLPYTIISELTTITGNISIWYGFTLIASPILMGIDTIQPLVLFGITTLLSKYYPHIIKEDNTRKTLIRKFMGTILVVIGCAVLVYTL